MKKAEVKVGGEYYANVTNKKVVVRVDAANTSGGWDATNLSTNKKIRIKTAQRLLGKARAATPASAASETRARKRVLKKTTSGDAATQPATKATEAAVGKKFSCIEAALKVLGETEETMNAQEMISAMTDAGYWTSPGGKTPHATLYSAILRELAKGDDSRFIKVERGRFAARA